MKVKVKSGIGTISNASRSYVEGIIYDIPNNKFDDEVFEKVSSDINNDKNIKRGKK
jgi:hypothetical protein